MQIQCAQEFPGYHLLLASQHEGTCYIDMKFPLMFLLNLENFIMVQAIKNWGSFSLFYEKSCRYRDSSIRMNNYFI